MDKKWNLQDIKPAATKKKRVVQSTRPVTTDNTEAAPTRARTEDDGTVHIAIENGSKKKRSGMFMTAAIFCLVILGGFFFSYLLSGAEVTVYPRHREPNVNANFEAYRTPQVGELSYEIMTLEADGERQVSATGQESVTEQATGELTIYKKTAGAERLIKNTRFATPDGLVFRITESAVVPGAVENADGEMVPGSIRATVFADEPGEAYNVGANTTFTVPGYKEGGYDALFAAVYAENNEAMTGGYDGTKFIIDETELETAKQALQTELRDALLGRVAGEQPAGFTLFEPAITFTYQTLPAVEYGENLATIKEKALLQVPLFKAEDLGAYLASATVPGYENEPVRIVDTNVLTFSYTQATTSQTNIGDLDSLNFKLVGKPHLVWTYDDEQLKQDLTGAAKTALTSILGGYPAIERAEATIRPFWKRSFPVNNSEISLTESLEAKQ